MGSEVQLTAWTRRRAGAAPAFEEVFDEFDRLDRLMSVWKEGSDVLRLNAAAGHAPVRSAPRRSRCSTVARQVSEWTGGKFDVTFGALSGLWKFDQDQDDSIPPRAAVRGAAARRRLHGGRARSGAAHRVPAPAGMRVHLGGIGKGYAVDRAAAILRARGVNDFMIQSGGDLFVSGRAATVRGGSASATRAARRIASSRRWTSRTARSARRATTSASS